MNSAISESQKLNSVTQKIQTLFHSRFQMDPSIHDQYDSQSLLQDVVKEVCQNLNDDERGTIHKEFFGFGPIETLIHQKDVTEIIILSWNNIWIEVNGSLQEHKEHFLNEYTYNLFIKKLLHETGLQLNVDHPTAQGHFQNNRIQIVSPPICSTNMISIRKHPLQSWSFQKLLQNHWATQNEINQLTQLVRERKNVLIVGTTGSGKTSLLNAMLNEVKSNERCVILEDSSELITPNRCSTKLLTRFDPQGLLTEVSLSELVKHTLRLRPDRIIMGEVRGAEATDLLMALATGHKGSLGSLHASHAQEALLRLEMLVQIGAPQWSLQAIRRLIQLSIDYVVVVEKDSNFQRKLKGIYKIASLEDFGFSFEKLE